MNGSLGRHLYERKFPMRRCLKISNIRGCQWPTALLLNAFFNHHSANRCQHIENLAATPLWRNQV
jgi:hypothetical protein